MVVLKKIKASSIVEVLTASVLIVVVFMVASLILNSVFKNTVVNTNEIITQRAKELHYLFLHKKISLPYAEDINGHTIFLNTKKEKLIISYGKENEEQTEIILDNF